MSRTLIWRNIKDLFHDVADYYENRNIIESYEAKNLREASPHWIRHSVATILGKHAKEQLGHATEKQTSEYQHQQYLDQVDAITKLDKVSSYLESYQSGPENLFILDKEIELFLKKTGPCWQDRFN